MTSAAHLPPLTTSTQHNQLWNTQSLRLTPANTAHPLPSSSTLTHITHTAHALRKPGKDSPCSPGEGGNLANCSKAVVKSHSWEEGEKMEGEGRGGGGKGEGKGVKMEGEGRREGQEREERRSR